MTSALSKVNGAEVVPAMVAVVRPLSCDSLYAVAAVRPVSAGAVSLMMVVSGMGKSFFNDSASAG